MAVTWGWLLVGCFCIIVALAMAEIASSMPTAGGLYYWASKLGSPGWGWFTGWFNLIGQISVTAAIDYGAATFVSSLLNLWFDMTLTKEHVFIVFTVHHPAPPRPSTSRASTSSTCSTRCRPGGTWQVS